MSIFKPVFANTTEILADVNEHFDNRREEKLILDTTGLVRAFKEKVECIKVVSNFAKRVVYLCNQVNTSYHYKEPKKEGSQKS